MKVKIANTLFLGGFFVAIFIQSTTAAEADWGSPIFTAADANGEISVSNDGPCTISVNEELSKQTNVNIDYKGTGTLAIVSGAEDYTAIMDKTKKAITFSMSPDFDLKYIQKTTLTITDGVDQKTCRLALINVDDNAPLVTAKPNSNCTINENLSATIGTCAFEVTDADGCVGAVQFDLSAQGATQGMFSMSIEKTEDYPSCLQNLPQVKSTIAYLKVNSALDYETAFNYFISINYQDKNSQPGLPLAQVLQVIDEPDMPPIWQQIKSTISVNEETESSTMVLAVDQDKQINNIICYSLTVEDGVSDTEMAYFEIVETTGELKIGKIDRDFYQVNSYTLTLIAQECVDPLSNVSSSMVVQVKDFINKNFTFQIESENLTNEYPKQTFKENTIPTLEHKIIVYDPDEGDSGTFEASLNNDKFSIIPSKAFKNGTFTIQGLTSFDYEDVQQRDFNILVTITEVADKSHKAEIPINIIIENVNDESPIFQDETNNQITFSVKERTASGVLGHISATDKDEGDVVTYKMMNYDGLAVDGATGEITITKDIFDFEQQPEVRIQVTAQDTAVPVHTTYAMIVIQVEDIDDEAPNVLVTTDTPGAIKVNEDAAMSFKLPLNISGSDKDSEANLVGSIDWEKTYGYKSNALIDSERIKDWFEIVQQPVEGKTDITMDLKVKSKLRWDVVDRIQLQFTVTDTNTIDSYTKESTGNINIEIVDVNDNIPVFVQNTCDEKRTVRENSQAGVTISTIEATDADGPGNNKITYFLDDANEKRFTIGSSTGLISTGEEMIDYEKDQSITINISVKDNDDSHKTTCSITIDVVDLNDNTPTATSDPANEIQIYENATESVIAIITGEDLDFSEPYHTMFFTLNSFQKYFALEDHKDGTSALSISLSDGSKFDFDDGQKSYTVTVQVTDNPDDSSGGGNQRTSTLSLTVNLLDVNDNAPVFDDFSEKNCFFTAKESAPENTTLTDAKISATDKDSAENAWISYSIESIECIDSTMNLCPSDKEDMFLLIGNKDDSTQGVTVDVKSKTTFKDKFGEYNVQIKAQDHGEAPLETVKTYKFCIEDENNNSPVFVYPNASTKTLSLQLDQNGNIVEGFTGLPITPFSVTDADFGNNALVDLTITPTDIFSIQASGKNEGRLVVKIDFAKLVETKATIRACDKPDQGSPNCQSTDLNITPRFTTNVEPEFEQPTFNITFQENSETEAVTIPLAHDKNNDGSDPSEEEKIYYYLIKDTESNEDYQEWFKLDQITGILTLQKKLDASIQDNYLLTVQTSNFQLGSLPKPQDPSLLKINLTVEDINDKSPVFLQENGYVISMSLSDQGRSIMTITAIDLDRHDTVKYSLLTDTLHSELNANVGDLTTLFTLNENTGAITVNHYPKEATQGFVSFQASATDGVHPVETLVTIYVVSDQYLIPAQFQNQQSEVAAHLSAVVEHFSEVFSATCVPGQVVYDSGYSTLFVHFENSEQQPLTPDTFDSIRANVTAMQNLRQFLLDEYSLVLIKFGTDAVPEENSDDINTALIAVTVVLAVLLLIAAGFHFIKTRRLNSMVDRLTNATAPMDDKKGFNLPNTNQNAASNPMYEQEVIPEFHRRSSVDSSNSDGSDLVGIEDNPEFETFYNNVILKAESERNQSNGFDDDMMRENPQLKAFDMTNVGSF